MIEIILAVVSAFALAYACVTHPVRFGCPGKMYLRTGVQPDGSFACAMPSRGEDTPGYPGVITGQVYCTGGTVPIVVDAHTAGCMRRPGS